LSAAAGSTGRGEAASPAFDRSAPPGASRRHARLIAAALLAVVAATFGNALQNGFVFDDQMLIVNNAAVRAPLGDRRALGAYRPLRILSYRLDYAIGGMDPRVFHLSNLLYHGLTVLLVCALLQRSGASVWAAGAGALLFAVHPVQTDAVTYAAGRRDVLCGLFFAAGFLAYLRYRDNGRASVLVLAGVAYVLAVLAKEMALTLPLVCLLVDRWRVRRRLVDVRAIARSGVAPAATGGGPEARRAPARPLVLAAALGAAGMAAFAAAYGAHAWHVVTHTPWHGGSIGANFATAARVWAHYLGLIVWPSRLSADYSYRAFPVSPGALDPRALASALVLAAVAVPAWRSWRRGGLAGFGAAWYAVALLPVSHIIPYSELLAEHYLYIPMVGVAFAVAGGVDAVAARVPERRRALAAAVLVIACAAAVRTAVRNRDWRDPVSLWSATVAAYPDCVRARFNLGQAYFGHARLTDAEPHWLAAAALRPDDPAIAMALAGLYYRLGKYDLAAERVETALRLRPDDVKAETLAGWIALGAGHPRRAMAHFDAALARLPPDQTEAVTLGRARAASALDPTRRPGTRLRRGPRGSRGESDS
jgi:hypothetical protein